ncbi:MAG: flagellar filament capping protein FliD [Nitrospirota bacterium]
MIRTERAGSSGIDVESIVKQLAAVERQPIDAIKRRQAVVTAKITAFSTLRTALSGLKTAVSPLQSFRSFQSKSATSTDSGTVAVTVNDSSAATIGSSTINQVITLASAQKLHSGVFTASTALVGTGTLKIKIGSRLETAIKIEVAQSNLTGIRDKINAAGAGVIASVIKSKDQVYKLVLQSSQAGTENTIEVNVVDDDGNHQDTSGLSQLRYTPKLAPPDDIKNLTEVQVANDAVFILDGETLTRSTNTISDAISGLTLTLLKKTDIDADIEINRSANTSLVKSQIEAFVAAYNEAILGLKASQKFDVNSERRGPLLGNITAQSVYNTLRLLPHKNVPDLEGAFKNFSDVGITLRRSGVFESDGTLTIDASVLEVALQEDSVAVGRVFAKIDRATDPTGKIPTSGIADQIEKAILGMIDGRSGRIPSAERGLFDTNSRIEGEILRLEEAVKDFERKTRKKFAKLEAALTKIQGTGSALDRQIQQLESVTSFVQQRNRSSSSR